MKRIFLAVMLAASLTLAGCPSTPSTQGGTAPSAQVVLPKSPTQTVYALEVSLTTATNALADLHNAGVVVGDNYRIAYDIQRRASATLKEAKAAAMAKDATKSEVLLHTLASLIEQLATYNGGKK